MSANGPADRLAFIAATVAVVATSIGGFLVLGSPNRQRQLQADRSRLQDLHAIARQLHDRFETANRGEKPFSLPETLRRDWRDPLTGEPYEYRPLDDERYQLCAEFALPTPEPVRNRDRFWQHPAGRHCFDLDATENPTFPRG